MNRSRPSPLYASRKTSITANGMICGSPRIHTLCLSKKLSRKSCTSTDLESSCTTPSASEPKNASGRLCIRAITTAANDPRIKNVNCVIANPFWVPSRTPATPASIVPIIHAPAETKDVLTPTMRAIAGESTVARIESPYGVARSSIVINDRDQEGGDDHGDVVRVDTDAEHLVGVRRVVQHARDLETIVPAVDEAGQRRQRDPEPDRRHEPYRRRCARELAEQDRPQQQAEQRCDGEDRDDPCDLFVPAAIDGHLVERDREKERDRAVREVEDARRRVREDEPEGGDRVDAADDEPGHDVGGHGFLPLVCPRTAPARPIRARSVLRRTLPRRTAARTRRPRPSRSRCSGTRRRSPRRG